MSKNLIYICVFFQETYIQLLELFISSIFINSKIDKNKTDILILTSSTFKTIIDNKISDLGLPIKYYILDSLSGLFEAGCARLNIFNYENIDNYEKILYLDIDILINSDINILFNLPIISNKIYTLEEGIINHAFWGKQFFDFNKINPNTTAFTSGILYFYNSLEIKSLFKDIRNHIQKYIYIDKNKIPDCLDQPFIVYNTINQNKYDNQLLKLYVENSPINVEETKIIYHFPGGPGNYKDKYDKMINFGNKIYNKYYLQKTSMPNLKLNEKRIMKYINNTVNIYKDVWTISDEMRNDIACFFENKFPDQNTIVEIGSYKGYTTNFLSRIFNTVYAIDNNKNFHSTSQSLNKDRTNIIYKNIDIYDQTEWNIKDDKVTVVFIDAGHSYKHCKSDIINSIKTFENLEYIIFDDYGVWPDVKKVVDEFINNNIFIFEKYIGVTDVPGPNNIIVKNVSEGIIIRINRIFKHINKQTYSWRHDSNIDGNITFNEDNTLSTSFGKGVYQIITDALVCAEFGNYKHLLKFNENYSFILSIRNTDMHISKAKLKL